jgi:hypothetical protein
MCLPATKIAPSLEIAGTLAMERSAASSFPGVVMRDSSGYKVVADHFQYHAAALAHRLNPKVGETIPAIVLESENQATVFAQLKILKFAA